MVTPFKPKTKLLMSRSEFDALVEEVYGRRYSFQQQDDCKERGMAYATVPVVHPQDYKNETVPEVINGDEMGVSFSAWLTRDPKSWSGEKNDALYLNMFWERNFYPHVSMVMNDLHAKGHLEAGEYVIEIDW